MINVNEIRAQMVRKGYTQKTLAKALGIAERTLQNKMKKAVFNSDEMYSMVRLLDIKEPEHIFFASSVN